MNRKASSVFFASILILFGTVLTGQANGSENSRALKGFQIKVTAADDKNNAAVNTVNGAGLFGDVCNNLWDGTWGTDPDVDGGGAKNPHPGTAKGATWIKFEFDRVYNLKEMWVWNYNENSPRGLKNVIIEYSTDCRTWKKLGDYVFAQAPGTPDYAHNTTIDFNGVAAKAVVITAKEGKGVGNYGDKMYGLSEVRFYVAEKSDDASSSQNPAKFIAPPAKLRLKLERGITIDCQLISDPPVLYRNITREDTHLIKSMGFEFVKMIINPAVYKSGDGLKASNMWFFDKIVNAAANEKLPVVVCIHPEADFKREYLGGKPQFESFLGFYKALAAYMAQRWNPDQLACQLMTEPFGSSSNPDDWNYWDTLQHRIWKTVRKEMPAYTLILSGDMIGQIEGVYDITPVDDENVMYSFTFYEPALFTHQGGYWLKNGGHRNLKNLPYPSSPEILKSMPTLLSTVPEADRASLKKDIERYANENWNRKRLAARIGKLVDWNNYYGGGLKIWCAEFGCYQNGANPADRCQYIQDYRSVLEENRIGWAYWSFNETFSVMTSGRMPFAPSSEQTPDRQILKALLPDLY